ncbi:AEC family transporter [Acinetobacter pragensis]|uniref:Permease n=1 Tax=Acinetobacter pragensis TaxID=1806892 RepID=A0A151Y4I5_9GAMM|nr:permease [Acinetobacter pragensis]KYQ72945.1 permease [Acinetobacter pragensis]
MALILPLVSFLIGFFGAEALKPFRALLAALLARLLIPVIIVYNMVFYKQGSLWLIGFSFISSLIFFGIFYALNRDKLRALCFSYLNGAWLGLPFALAVFGPNASSTIVALYIGGSLFGNICAVMAVSEAKQDLKFIVKNVLLSPPVIALSASAVLSFWDFSAFEHHPAVQWAYALNKVLVTFSGMCVLGMWLSKVRIGWQDLQRSLLLIGGRMILSIFLCLGAYALLPIPHAALTYAVIFMFFCLPPAANIVALETHYQGTGHSAKYIASGTLASAMIIAVYGLAVHMLVPAL